MILLRSPILTLTGMMLVWYGLIPLFASSKDTSVRFLLAGLTLISVIFILLGGLLYRIFFEEIRLRLQLPRLRVQLTTFTTTLWGSFILFLVVVFSTAEAIPVVAAITGADAGTVAYLRERFLKAREGWQVILVYINAAMCGALIPYSLAKLFAVHAPSRWILLGAFFIYCLSFMEKAFFLKAVLPLMFLVAVGSIGSRVILVWMIAGSVGVIMLLAMLGAGGGEQPDWESQPEPYLSAGYQPSGPRDHLIWRAIAVPVFTALDSLDLHEQEFLSEPLLGTTSTFLAKIGNRPRVEFEREVFAFQWGQNETGTGSANSIYFIEAFVNFGWFGVIIASFFIGYLLTWMVRGGDIALAALWPLFAFGIFTSGLIGLLLSNGFIVLFLIAFWVRFVHEERFDEVDQRESDCRS